jgi:hypothetical protein
MFWFDKQMPFGGGAFDGESGKNVAVAGYPVRVNNRQPIFLLLKTISIQRDASERAI